jgi:hypothetical protein
LVTTTLLTFSPTFTLPATFSVSAVNVASGARVSWDGQEIPTQFVSSSRLDVTPPPADLTRLGVHRLSVTSGGVQSSVTAVQVGFDFYINAAATSPDRARVYILGSSAFSSTAKPAELAILDTATGKLQTIIPTKIPYATAFGGARTLSIAVSENGQYVYISGSTSGLVQRLNASTNAFDLEWTVAEPTPDRTVGIYSLAPMAGTSESLVVHYFNADGVSLLSIFDGSQKRPLELAATSNYARYSVWATGDRAVLYGGPACWDSFAITAGGFVSKDFVCRGEPDDTISEAGAHYVKIGNATILVSLPLTSLFQIPAPQPNGIVDLETRRVYYVAGSSPNQIWEYNLDTGEQRIRSTLSSTPNGLVQGAPGSILVYANWIAPLP